MKTILLTLSIFISSLAGAQDYVVTMKNDTIKGQIKILTYDRLDRVDVSADKKKSHFTCLQLKTVFFQNEIYNTVKTPDGFRLMKLKQSGFVSIYLARKPQGYLYEMETLVKRDGSSLEVPGLSFKKVMSSFLSDCDLVVEGIKSEQFTRKNIPDLVNEYNKCVDTKTRSINSSVATTDTRIVSLKSLKEKIEASSLSTKKDAIDILNDISAKVTANQSVPNYLIEGLKENIKDSPELLADFDKVIPTFNK